MKRKKLSMKILKNNWTGLIGLIIFTLMVLIALLAEFIAPYDPLSLVSFPFAKPSSDFVFGTDEIGRDLLSRVIFGSRISLFVGFISSSIGLLIGLPLGLTSGYYGGKLDAIIMRIMDALLSIPAILLALVIITLLGPDIYNAMIAIGIIFIPTFARLIRSSVLSLREIEFVESARSIGASDLYLITKTILPNCLTPIIVQYSFSFASAVLIEASLSFLGLGTQPPTPSWGEMLNIGRQYLRQSTLYSTVPGIMISLTVLSLNLIGDTFREVFDPKHINK